MAVIDPATVEAVWHTATIRDGNNQPVAFAAYWGDPDGRPIEDAETLAILEERMAAAKSKQEYHVDDPVTILDDNGDPTDMEGFISQELGMDTFLVELPDRRLIGTQASHLQSRKEE